MGIHNINVRYELIIAACISISFYCTYNMRYIDHLQLGLDHETRPRPFYLIFTTITILFGIYSSSISVPSFIYMYSVMEALKLSSRELEYCWS